MKRHVVLVGLSGSGKSVVGQLVARELGASLVDVDCLIEEQQGSSIRAIFADRGESVFRELERLGVRAALETAPCVIVPGGGWAAQEGNLADAVGKCLVVYLRTDAREAARRLSGTDERPLLAADGPTVRMAELLEARAPFYEQAERVVETNGRTVDEVARDVVALARNRAGW